MRTARLVLMLALTCIVARAALELEFDDGTRIRIVSVSDQRGEISSGMVGGTPEQGYRVFTNRAEGEAFAYTITAHRDPDGTYTLRLGPLSMADLEKLRGSMPQSLGTLVRFITIRTLEEGKELNQLRERDVLRIPAFPNPDRKGLREGDVLRIPMFRNPTTGEEIYDMLTMLGQRKAESRRLLEGQSSNQGFHLDDVMLLKNGRNLLSNFIGDVTGNAILIYIQGYGAFLFSKDPPETAGFQLIGEVEGSRLSFQWGEDKYEVISRTSILPESQTVTVWVCYAPKFTPDQFPPWMARNSDGTSVAAAGSVKSFLSKQR